MNNYQPKNIKLKKQVTEATKIMESRLGTTKTKETQTKRLKALIDNTEVSNLKRALWIGYLLGKHSTDYFELE